MSSELSRLNKAGMEGIRSPNACIGRPAMPIIVVANPRGCAGHEHTCHPVQT